MIRFDEKRHLFNDGQVPSVTTILKEENWIDTRFYSEDGRTRGEYVHKASAMLDAGMLDWQSIDPDVVKYLVSYERAKLELGIKRFAAIERIVHSGVLWAGIEDRSVKWKGHNCPLDLKTGAYEMWHKVQIAGYAECYRTRPPYCLMLYLTQEKYKLIELTVTEMEPYYVAWHSAVTSWWSKRTLK